MKVTPYNRNEAIEMLMARAYLLLMSDEVPSIKGRHAKALFDIVGHMTKEDAYEAIAAFEETQTAGSR